MILFIDKTKQAIHKNEQNNSCYEKIDFDAKGGCLTTVLDVLSKKKSDAFIIQNVIHAGLYQDFLEKDYLSELEASSLIANLQNDCKSFKKRSSFYPY